MRISGYHELDDTKLCYWRTTEGWLFYMPGCGLGNLSLHEVVEHEDGTITVSPSILLTGHDSGKRIIRHGFLVRGVWQPCSDDNVQEEYPVKDEAK